MCLLTSVAYTILQWIFGTSCHTGMLNIEACCHSAIEPQNIKAKNWKQSKSLSTGEQRKKFYGISIQWDTTQQKKERNC